VYAAAPIETRPETAVPIDLDSAVKASELQVIMAALQSTDSRLEAAAKLGISPRTLRYKLAQMRTRGMHEGVLA
jgi:two-component system response regulator FlrC